MQQGSSDYASSHYYPHQYAPPLPNPNTNTGDVPITVSYASAPPYSGGYSDHPPSAPSYSQPPQFAAYPPYNPPPYPPAPYYTYPPAAAENPSAAAAPTPYPPYNTGYYDNSGSYGGGGYQDLYGGGGGGGGKKPEAAMGYDQDDSPNEGVYAYNGGGHSEPYGARGTAPTRSGAALFDDYGRSISFPSGGAEQQSGGGSLGKIVRAVPKADAQEDVKSGVQKFRVKLLPEGAGSTIDVLCQIGLDGIRMLDPSTNRTLKIYPLETVTRWEVLDSSIFAFWSKSSVDIEPKRIRLKSNSYTSNTILDTVTAATVQFKEMGGNARGGGPVDTGKLSEQSNEKKKGFDWMFTKPADELKDHWVPDEAVKKCTSCGVDFSPFNRRHHCRNCGDIFCDKCSQGRIALTADDNAQPVRVCDRCMAEVSQRLSNAKEAANKSATLQSHEDLARKLKEEMDRNHKSSGSASKGGSGTRMREVACPICTVHLQVQVPTSGSETVECGVCQHAFLVSAH